MPTMKKMHQLIMSLFAVCEEDIVCGIDEAERGLLSGPVFAAATILDSKRQICSLRASKKLTEVRRDELVEKIKERALARSIAAQSCEKKIYTKKILQVTMRAMRHAFKGLSIVPTLAMIDGNCCSVMNMCTEAVIQRDDKVRAISAAFILDKTAYRTLYAPVHALLQSVVFEVQGEAS